MFLNIDQQLERCARVIRQRVRPHVHPVIESLSIEAFDIPGEPIPADEFFARLDCGEIPFEPFEAGSPWGTTWGTVWFKLTGRVPQSYPQGRPLELILDLGWYDHSVGGHIEGMVYRPDGTVIKAVHPRNYWVPFVDADGTRHTDLDEDGGFTVYLEAACNPLLLGVTPFIETELGDHATGKPEEQYVFRSASLTEYDARFEDYWLDLDAVSGLMAELPDKRSARYFQLGKALQRSLNAFDEQRLDSVEQARAELADVLARPANASAMRVSAVGHAHIDSAWLWPVRETRRKVARTVSNALALMDESPDFKYAMSSAQQYAWLEQDRPDLFARMKRRIEEGRFIPVGGMWVESDGNLPDGESLIRQISFGRRYFKEHLGVEPRGIWLPDSFGYTGAWPQIARRAGYDWFLTQKISWNDTTKFPHHSFLWEGLDGTRIFTHFPPSDTYAAWVTAKEMVYTEHNFQDKDLSTRALMLFGYGDGGGGPTREMIGSLHRFRDLEGLPKVEIEAPDEFFDAARAQLEGNAGEETPVYKGELYLELHRGTLTAQQEMKRGCREEESLLRAVEYLCAAATLADGQGYAYPREELDRIWTTLLLNQFHDILPGSSIPWVHREARADYARDLKRLAEIAQEACAALRASNPTADLLDEARIAQYRVDGGSWTPAAATRSADDSESVAINRCDGRVVMDNGLLAATIEADGTVSSLVDKRRDRELVPAGMRLGVYELLHDEPSVWDAWDIERDAFLNRDVIGGGRIVDVSLDACGTACVTARVEFSDSVIDTTISLAVGAGRLDFSATVDWRERERFLKVDFPIAVAATQAQYDCQYGLVERPIAKNSRGDEAKYESCTRRFVRVNEPGYSVAVVNGSVYGSDVAPIAADAAAERTPGTMFRLSLLSAPVFPDPRADIGTHGFRWSVLADATIERTLQTAAELNAPLLHDVPAIAPLACLDTQEGVPVIDWIKLADDGSGDLIVRLYEAAGGRAKAALRVSEVFAGGTVRETTVTEADDLAADLPVCLETRGSTPAQGARIHLAPFQLATLRISR
ncbi:alpha-mannosidase [Bifidobacterium eulemuris]|uniref:Alpha-mannosidase n=1 Tax=Bifidobacterium eulemuris TaxID=1765219 RepID=A0A261G9I1_9BIFI|nr:alpha-mannosidase [Bifidobacterium eulemuris]OZG68068.1 alpha-mannosidase [Bifidobacterium eulemuris]QOL31858.1 alpha-mannosidase [Bifidobacterium eulemuris]